MPALSDLEWQISASLPMITMWAAGVIVVAVIVIALKALRRALDAETPEESEEMVLKRRYREGVISLREYEGEREKLLQVH